MTVQTVPAPDSSSNSSTWARLSRWTPALVACVLGLAMTQASVVASRFHSLHGDMLDGRIVNYFLEHGYRWLRGEPLHASLWDAPFFYPMPNAMAYSDVMIGAVALYAPFRLLGIAPDTSLQLWLIAALTANFWAMYALTRGGLGLPAWPSAVAAFVVAFGAPRSAQVGHPQLVPQCFALVALLLIIRALRDVPPHRSPLQARAALLPGAAICLVLQFYASVYLGWLTCLALLVAAGVSAFWSRERGLVLRLVRHGWIGLAAGVVVFALAMTPFVQHYRAAAAELGPRSWDEVSCFLPRLATWLTPSPGNWIYGTLATISPSDDPCRPEKSLSVGYVTWLAAIAGLVVGRRRPEARVVGSTLVGLVVLSTSVYGVSVWRLVYDLVPGAIAIRAVGRIVLVALVPVALALAYLLAHLDATRRRGLALGLGAVCMLEQGETMRRYDRDEARNRIGRAAGAIPDGCQAFHLVTELHPVHTAITAMWAGLARQSASVNGHSGSWPPGYPFPAPPIVERAATVARWVEARGGRARDVCMVDAQVRARLVSADVPRLVPAGSRHRVTLVVDNLGPHAWQRSRQVRLGVVGAVDWGIGRVELPHDVPPDGRVTFTFEVQAPVSPAVLPFQWGIVEEGVEWITEDLGAGRVTVVPAGTPMDGVDRAVLVSADVPRQMTAGQRSRVVLVVRNAGTKGWRRAERVMLGSQEPENNVTWGVGRVPLTADVAPGAVAVFAFDVVAPAATGTHAFSWAIVREGVSWVEPLLRAGPVTVTANPAQVR